VRKSALIVDDSKSARVVLKRMLEMHALEVDTAESAESALEYLNDHRPDVIFMDHLMPGMDGFEAVSAIKNNPDTATIPIMMYTSQEGELYVGQARALGAIGVLPKAVQPVEVSKVLRTLRVIGDTVDPDNEADAANEPRSGREPPEPVSLDRNLRELIQNLFDEQRAVMRRDLLDSYEAIAARVADEIRAPRTEEQPEDEHPEARRVPARYRAVLAVLATASIVFGWLYWQSEKSWQATREQYAALIDVLEEQQSMEADGALEAERRLASYERSLDSTFVAALSALEWAVNRAGSYGYYDLPLGDGRLALVQGLTDRLLELGFSGEVLVETHIGDFCMVGGGANGLELAPPEMNSADCMAIGYESGEALELGLRQSVAFANFVRMSQARTDGRIRYAVVSRGNAEPLVEYPALPDVSAGTWNEIAQANNRVEITLFPDA
jgi:CheY-like chemotaxis protein